MGRIATLGVCLLMLGSIAARRGTSADFDPLPEFKYRTFTVRFTDANGKPLRGASIYGFCRELNLLWPRRDDRQVERNSFVWQEEALENTGADGTAQVVVPPGKWGFFAAADGVVAWTDFRDRSAGEVVQLRPTMSKHLTLIAQSATLAPAQLFFAPENFPVWLAVSASSPTIQIPAAPFHLWASGNPSGSSPGFILDFGTITQQTADAAIPAKPNTATLMCKGGNGAARLLFSRYQGYGLSGELSLPQSCRILVSSGPYSIGYQRPVPGGYTGVFTAQYYSPTTGQSLSLDLDTPLSFALDQDLAQANAHQGATLNARLYVVDGNGHFLAQAVDSDDHPAPFHATVTVGGKTFDAPAVHVTRKKPRKVVEQQTVVSADVPALDSAQGASWTFTSPAGLVPTTALTDSTAAPGVAVATSTFRTQVPQLLVPRARNILVQCELLARAMEQCSSRARQHVPTQIILRPQSGASAGHAGDRITIGSELLFSDAIYERHVIAHELGHNFQLTHGGLHEMIVEAARCGPNPAISEQPVRWMFFDRMNGRGVKEIWYPNSPLYYYFYAQSGLPFLRFMSANEPVILRKLGKQFTDDELTVALCTLAMHRDVGAICRAYGLEAAPEKVEQALAAARPLCR